MTKKIVSILPFLPVLMCCGHEKQGTFKNHEGNHVLAESQACIDQTKRILNTQDPHYTQAILQGQETKDFPQNAVTKADWEALQIQSFQDFSKYFSVLFCGTNVQSGESFFVCDPITTNPSVRIIPHSIIPDTVLQQIKQNLNPAEIQFNRTVLQ